MRNADRGVEDTEVIVDFRRRGDGGAGIGRCDALFNRNGGRESLDVIDLRLLHPVQELPGIGGETLDIAPLSLGKERVKGERRLSRATRPGDDDQLVPGNRDIKVTQIMLPCALDPDETLIAHRIRNVKNLKNRKSRMIKIWPSCSILPDFLIS